MESKYIIKDGNNSRLVLFFTGWSTDWRILAGIEFPTGYDVIVCWDYRDLQIPHISKKYIETIVIAWSFGVAAVDFLYSDIKKHFNPTGVYAIAGSTHPSDNERGINEIIYENTLRSLNEATLRKFRMRISGGSVIFNERLHNFPDSDNIEELKNELEAVRQRQTSKESSHINTRIWDRCFISSDDAVFPVANLLREWKTTPVTVMDGSSHYPDFQNIIDTIVRDKELIRKSFTAKLKGYDAEAEVQKKCADMLWNKISGLMDSSVDILEVGRGSGYLSSIILSGDKCRSLTSVDLVEPAAVHEKETILCGDGEILLRSFQNEIFDLVITSSTVQWFHSFKRFIEECYRIVKIGGLTAIATFTEGTLERVSRFTGRSLPYFKPSEIKSACVDAGFEVVESCITEFNISFSDALQMLSHLSHTGVNALNRRSAGVETIRRIVRDYPKENDGTVKLEFPAYFIILRKG